MQGTDREGNNPKDNSADKMLTSHGAKKVLVLVCRDHDVAWLPLGQERRGQAVAFHVVSGFSVFICNVLRNTHNIALNRKKMNRYFCPQLSR